VFDIASECFAYYESPVTSVAYSQDRSLQIQLWFKTEENLRTFVNKVGEVHTYYRLPPPIEWNITYEAVETPPLLHPVMKMDYLKGASSSPEYTPQQSHASDVSAANASNAEVYFRLIERPNLFAFYNPTSCHIADKSDFPDYDKDPDNRLYLSQPVHYLFDGYQTAETGNLTKKYPLFGVYFVRDEGEEVIEFHSVRYHMHKIIIAFETVARGVAETINFKAGSFVENGVWHTYIHVNNPEHVKLYLTLKYLKAAKKWDKVGIKYQHREVVDNSEAIGTTLGGLSLKGSGSEEEV
jgi:hypothetical protein